MSRRFEALAERLLRAGVAPRHVRRTIGELRDHFDDLVHEGIAGGLPGPAAEDAARTRIGSDDTLAAEILARPELRSIAARHPLAVFGLGPVLMLVGFIALAVVLEAGILELHLAFVRVTGTLRPPPPEWLRLLVATLNGIATYGAPLLIAGGIFLLGVRQRTAPAWMLAGAAIVCILGGFHAVTMTWSTLPGHSELGVGFGLAPPFPHNMIIAGLWRVGANLAVAGLVYRLWLRRYWLQSEI